MPREIGPLVRKIRLLTRNPPVAPNYALELRRGGEASQMEEIALGLGRGHPRQGPDLRERELALPKSLHDQGQISQATGHANVLAGRPRRDRAAPGDPFRRAAAARATPPLA